MLVHPKDKHDISQNGKLHLHIHEISCQNYIRKVKMQYAQILNIIDTFIKCPISDQFTTRIKGMYGHNMFHMVDTAFSYSETLIVC